MSDQKKNNGTYNGVEEPSTNTVSTATTEQGFLAKAKTAILAKWSVLKEKHPTIAQFIMFFIVCNGVTVLQMIFNLTSLVDINFQVGHIGSFNDAPYYMFNYPSGATSTGGGGGLAYFLALQITLAIAQVINFFAQKNVTFKSNGNVWYAAMWYAIAYVIITLVAAAAQGFYKQPIYDLFINATVIADFITMIITCAISFWVFFPIMKFIFKQKKECATTAQ